MGENGLMDMPLEDAFAMLVSMAPPPLQALIKKFEPQIEKFLADPAKYAAQLKPIVEKFLPQLAPVLLQKISMLEAHSAAPARVDENGFPLAMLRPMIKALVKNAPKALKSLKSLVPYVTEKLGGLWKMLPKSVKDMIPDII